MKVPGLRNPSQSLCKLRKGLSLFLERRPPCRDSNRTTRATRVDRFPGYPLVCQGLLLYPYRSLSDNWHCSL
jgi:hypothetical protein